jgi:hypothetical protein
MKHIKKFNESYVSTNEEFIGAAIIGAGALLAAPAAYEWAKKFWSKNVVGSKYEETGKKEVIVTKLPENIATTVILSKQERESGEVRTELREYKDNLDNTYWGYDHLWAPEGDYFDYQQYTEYADLYTALFKAEDFGPLKEFLQNPVRYTGNYNIQKPKPIEMIYKQEA